MVLDYKTIDGIVHGGRREPVGISHIAVVVINNQGPTPEPLGDLLHPNHSSAQHTDHLSPQRDRTPAFLEKSLIHLSKI